jgi:outer membrane protein assembly factor BamB
VFFGTFDGHFFAVDAKTGAARWTISTGPLVAFSWGHESGDRYTSSLTVLAASRISARAMAMSTPSTRPQEKHAGR